MFDKGNGPRRPFATGSKPGPDAVDHYLEEKGFYRKHTARDASSLFRVISEQVFDVQNYHEKIRQDCAAFMEDHSKEYQNEVDKNFYNYVSHLRRPRTHGSLLELKVMARMYRKNVILYEPTQNLQTSTTNYVKDDSYGEEPLRVFYSHKDKHFDVIYTMEYVEKLAECQALVYSLLYTNVFNLPDVQYAVERMLHDQEEELTLPLTDDPSKYQTQSGDVIPFNEPEGTNCVLKDPKTCHFHNQEDFQEVVNMHKDAITIINRTDEPGRLKIYKPIDGFLHDKSKSCVRQLLDEHITPFPYKVAKALDPSIYRNTEFELWSENRKEQRLKWLDSPEYPMKPHFDDKWLLYDRRQGPYGMRKFGDSKYEPAVVDESAYMALDENSKKKYVILNPTAEPFKLHHLTGLDHFMPSNDSLELTVMPANINYTRGNFKNKRPNGRFNGTYHSQNSGGNYHHQNNGNHSFKREHHQNQQTQMPHVSDIERENSFQYAEPQEPQEFYQQQEQQGQVNYQESFEQQHQQPMQAMPQQMYQTVPQQASWSNGQMVSFMPPQAPYPVAYQPLNYQAVMPYGNFSIPPPVASFAVQPPAEPAANAGDSLHLIREAELASSSICWSPRESSDSNGTDLPLTDIPTLQFYFNVGVRYYQASGVRRQLESVATQLENLELNENSSAGGLNVEKSGDLKDPPVPTNTPVTTKSQMSANHGPPGHRYHNQHGSFRRPFGGPNNRDSRDNRDNGGNYRSNWNSNNNNSTNNSRKEIKFNSNVKNAHKIDTKTDNGNTLHVGSQTQLNQSSGGQASLVFSGSNSNVDKASPNSNANLTAQHSPVSPIQQEQQQQAVHYHHQQQMSENLQQPHIHPYYSSYPSQQMQAQQQGVTMIYQIPDESGGYMVPMHQSIPYHQSYSYQPQPLQTPVFYQVPNYQQTPTMEASSLSNNDSGVVDTSVYQGYQQPVQFYSQYQPQPMYYAPTPMPQTPQIAQIAPMFPQPMLAHQVQQAPPPVVAVAPLQNSTQLDRTLSAHSDENSADNSVSA